MLHGNFRHLQLSLYALVYESTDISLVWSNMLNMGYFDVSDFAYKMPTFLVVDFLKGGWTSVVPHTWVFQSGEGKLQCYWTSSLKKVAECQKPNVDKWPVYDLRRIVGKRGNCPNCIYIPNLFGIKKIKE